MIDVLLDQDRGERPDIITATDTGSSSGIVFGLVQLLRFQYRTALADLPNQKGWRIDMTADYGPAGTFARRTIDLAKIRKRWADVLRVVVSIRQLRSRADPVDPLGRHRAEPRLPYRQAD